MTTFGHELSENAKIRKLLVEKCRATVAWSWPCWKWLILAKMAYLAKYESYFCDLGVVGILQSCTINVCKQLWPNIVYKKVVVDFSPVYLFSSDVQKNSLLLYGVAERADFLHTTVFDSEESESDRIFDRENLFHYLPDGHLSIKNHIVQWSKKFQISKILAFSDSSHRKTVVYQKLAHSELSSMRKVGFE